MAFFVYFNYTTCIEQDNLNILAETITQLIAKEDGCYPLIQLPKLNCSLKELEYHPLEKLSDLWIICLFKGAEGWTTVKTFPKGLLCNKSSITGHSRLADLAKILKCNAFHLEVHQEIAGFLFEADSLGNTFLSGCPGEEVSPNYRFYDELIVNKPDLITQFSLIDVPESIEKAIKINHSPEVQKQQAKIDEMDRDDPEYFDLVVNDPGYTKRIDLAIADLFDPNRDYWFIDHDLAYRVYKELERLESIGAKVMYFSPPNYYRPYTRPKVDLSQNVSDENEMPF